MDKPSKCRCFLNTVRDLIWFILDNIQVSDEIMIFKTEIIEWNGEKTLKNVKQRFKKLQGFWYGNNKQWYIYVCVWVFVTFKGNQTTLLEQPVFEITVFFHVHIPIHII